MSEIIKGLTTNEKLKILADAAKYDVACTPAEWTEKARKEPLAIVCPAGYATALLQMDGAYHS